LTEVEILQRFRAGAQTVALRREAIAVRSHASRRPTARPPVLQDGVVHPVRDPAPVSRAKRLRVFLWPCRAGLRYAALVPPIRAR